MFIQMAQTRTTTNESVSNDAPRARALRELRNWMSSGLLRQDDLLPSERELSQRIGVGRATIRRAIQRLTEEGLIRPHGPRGRLVADPGPHRDWVSKSIVLLVPEMRDVDDPASRTRWTDYLTLGALTAIRAAGLHSVSIISDEFGNRDIARLAVDRPTGVIVPEVFGGEGEPVKSLIDRLLPAGVRTVVYGGNPELASYDRVMSDHEQGSYLLTRALIARGRRRIAQCWVQPWDRYWLLARDRGYQRAMREAGLRPLDTIETPRLAVRPDARQFLDGAKHVAGYLLERFQGDAAPDALLLGSDRNVFVTAAALRMLGRNPDTDVLLAGYDNFHAFCEERHYENTLPALTVDKRNDLMGHEMVDLLLARSRGQLRDEPQTRVVPPELVEVR